MELLPTTIDALAALARNTSSIRSGRNNSGNGSVGAQHLDEDASERRHRRRNRRTETIRSRSSIAFKMRAIAVVHLRQQIGIAQGARRGCRNACTLPRNRSPFVSKVYDAGQSAKLWPHNAEHHPAQAVGR